jgi:hypothetical protein
MVTQTPLKIRGELQIFHNGQPSHGGDRKTVEVMTST